MKTGSTVLAQRSYAAIVSSAMDAIISIDAQQRIVLFNPAAERIFGVPAREALGQPIERFIPNRFRGTHADHVKTFGKTGVGNRRMREAGDAIGLRANGEEFPVECSISRVESGGRTQFSAVVRDVSERRRTEEALRQNEQRLEKIVAERTAELRECIAELEAFSYSLSHDMRAPLRAIRDFSQVVLAENGEKIGAPGTDYLKIVIKAAERLDRLTQDVLTFARLSCQPMQLEAVDVEKLVRSIISERPEWQPPRAVVEIASPLLPLGGNEASLTQCVTNLLGNAVKFVAHGTTPWVRISTEAGGDKVRLWFADNGIGIDKRVHRKIFDMFQRQHSRAEYEGSGLGLAIVRRAVERMGGEVGVVSEPGQGSRFWIELPKAQGAEQPKLAI